MKIIILFLSLLGSSVVAADTAYHGADNNFQKCFLTLHDSGEFSMKAQGYFFTKIQLGEDNGFGQREFYGMTKDQGDNTFKGVDGPEGSFDRIGILEVNGVVMFAEGRPYSITLFASGGLFNWYSKQFACSDLK